LIPITELRSSPFFLPWGAQIVAIVSATNIYGTSVVSVAGSGAIIYTRPSAPTNFINVVSITSSTQIGLSWSDCQSNGGSNVIDYTISYD